MLRIYAFAPSVSDTLGPGNRAVVWVQGCTLRCPGCMVPEAWNREGGFEIAPSELAEKISNVPNLEGVTISGGEAFEQPEDVASLLRPLKEEGFNTWIYTGYTLEELIAMNDPNIDRLLSFVDTLVDGRFQETIDVLPFRGSANQRIIRLTNAISIERINFNGKSRVEIALDPAGHMTLIGIPPRGFMPVFREKIEQRGVSITGQAFNL